MDNSYPPPEIPEINILLLGDAEVGKSTFMSRLTLGVHQGGPRPNASSLTPTSREDQETLPPYSLPVLRDSDQPFVFNITLWGRPYTLLFSDTASPTNYTLLRPDFVILAYDISRRETLESLKGRWREVLNKGFMNDEGVPVMVLGLKRDLRREWGSEGDSAEGPGSREAEAEMMVSRESESIGVGYGNLVGGGLKKVVKGRSVMPQEGLGVAQVLTADLYAECSALTGELCREVLHDIAKTAAKTTTEMGGKSAGANCAVM